MPGPTTNAAPMIIFQTHPEEMETAFGQAGFVWFGVDMLVSINVFLGAVPTRS